MKQILSFLLILLFTNCTSMPPVEQTDITATKHIIVLQPYKYTVHEWSYKGHIYLSCEVRDGMALTHAGHCSCNK
jgi:hypothetical protein